MNPRLLPVFAAMSVAPLLCSWGAATLAAPPMLKGQYAFSGEAGCISTTAGFNSNLTPAGPSSLVLFSVHGVRHFNGDGTGTVKGTSVSTSWSASAVGSSSADANDFQFSFTYTVGPDGKITSEVVPGSYLGTFTAGPRAGQTVTIDNIPLLAMASIDNKTLVLATPVPAVETQNFSNGDVRQRICHRSRTLVRIHGHGSEDGETARDD